MASHFLFIYYMLFKYLGELSESQSFRTECFN